MADGFVTVQYSDVSHIVKALQGLSREVADKVLTRAVRGEVREWQFRAALTAPESDSGHFVGRKPNRKKVAPGNLRRNIRVVKIRAEGNGLAQSEVRYGIRISRKAYYWQFHEFGTAKMSARPFLRPTFDEKKEGAFIRVSNATATYIESYFKRQKQDIRLARIA